MLLQYGKMQERSPSRVVWLLFWPTTAIQIMWIGAMVYSGTERLPFWYPIRIHADIAEHVMPVFWMDELFRGWTIPAVAKEVMALGLGFAVTVIVDFMLRKAVSWAMGEEHGARIE